MTVVYLLNTNVLAQPVRPSGNTRVLERLEAHRGEVAIPAPVLHEITYGYLILPPSRKRELLAEYVATKVRLIIPVLPYDDRAAHWHAEQRAILESVGRSPALLDGQIAAIAATNELILATGNTRHFADFPELQAEDWFE
jgi:tRNA(fMet)-specific endonuclease VapC